MTVASNTITQSGVVTLPSGQPSLPMPSFAALHAGPNATVSGNSIRQSSYHGIVANKGTLVRDNLIQNTCKLLDDCGGIYMSGAANNSTVDGNLVLDIDGNPNGNPEIGTHVVGIYLDELTSGTTVSGNTVANADHGIQLHNTPNNQILNNTLYGNRKYQIWLQEGSKVSNGVGDVHSNTIRQNRLFPTNNYPALSQDTQFATTVNFANFDLNIYSALYSANILREKSSLSETLYQFPAWQAATSSGTPRNLDPGGRQIAQIGYTSFEVAGTNILTNGDLSAGIAGWGKWDSAAPAPQMAIEMAGAERWIKLTPGGNYSLFYPGNFSSTAGQWYRLTFDLKTRLPNQKVVIAPRRGGGGANGYELVTDASRYVLGQPTWKRYSLNFQGTKTVILKDLLTGDAGARIDFQQIRTGEEIYLAKVELVPIRPVGTTLRPALLTNTNKTSQAVGCPVATTTLSACNQFIRFSDGLQIAWPYLLSPLGSEIVYTRDDSMIDSDSDGIANMQDACPFTAASDAANAAGCALNQNKP